MGKALTPLLLLLGAACSNSDNAIFGAIPPSDITPPIEWDDIGSSISGRVGLSDAAGNPLGIDAQVVIMTDRPGLCAKLQQQPDYFRNPTEAYLALILFLPANDHLGTFLPGRGGDEGTGSEIIGSDPSRWQPSIDATGGPLAPFRAVDAGYITLSDWTETTEGETRGTFSLVYAVPPPLVSVQGFVFSGKFKASGCPGMNAALLP
ncbi:MAG TPA: hypothetical protein VMK66_11340 [Myxococcales bacterium]|nr:hypothetical protein [Myxococcales bacterium]